MLKTLKQNSKRLFYKHKVVTRVTSMLLVFTLLFTSLPLGGMVASAAEVDDENTIITVEKELTEYRTEYSKTYLMSNNTLESVVSANPMHYKNDSGNWVDIDSTLVLEETEDGEVYKNKAGGFDVSFPATNENGSSVKIESGEHTIEIELVEGKKSHARKDTSNKNKAKKLTKEQRKLMTASELYAVDSNQNSALEYNDIYDNTNVRYDINATSVKESVIITKAPNKKVSYSYNIKADGLMAELNDDGSISFYEKTDTKKQNAVFVMPAPLMYDANDIYCYDIETTLKQKKGVYVLTYKPDYNWLKAKDRAYPVVLDPTTYVANSTQDAYTYSADEYQNRNIGSENQIKVGRSTWKDPNGDTFETFIRFDELPTMPEGFAVSSALLMLTTKAYHGTWQELEVGAHKITEDWTNKLNQPLPLINYLNQPDAESLPRATAHITRGEVDAEVGFEISEIVNEWYEDPTTNYGVKLSLAETPPTDADNVLFHSSRATSGVPYLSITYDVYAPVTDIEITQSKETLDCEEDGYNFNVAATVSPENASYKKVDWQVADESVAFYYDGVIYAKGNGETTVTAVSVDDNTVTDSFDLEITNVQAIAADNFSIINLPKDNKLALNKTHTISVMAVDSNTEVLEIQNENITWQSSNAAVATINPQGEIAPVSLGTTVITATFAGATANFTLTVTAPEVTAVDFGDLSDIIIVGNTVTFTGMVYPANAADLRTTCEILDYADFVDNAEELDVATVTKTSASDAPATEFTQYTITADEDTMGVVTLRLKSVQNENIYKDITLYIDSAEAAALGLRRPKNGIIIQSESFRLTKTYGITFTSENPSILSYSNGIVTALAEGTTEVDMSDGINHAHFELTVVGNYDLSITNTPFVYDENNVKLTNTMLDGETFNELKLKGGPADPTRVIWASSDPTVANVYYSEVRGKIILEGLKSGKTIISANVKGTECYASFELTVCSSVPDYFEIKAVAGTGIDDNVLFYGERGKLELDLYPKNKTFTYSKVNWFLLDGSNETVSISNRFNYAVITPKKAGYVEIDAEIDGVYSLIYFPLTVKRPNVKLNTVPYKNILCVGQNQSLGHVVEPSYATVKWEVIRGANSATISGNALVPKKSGTVVLRANICYNKKVYKQTFSFRVVELDSIFIWGDDGITVGDTCNLTLDIYPSSKYNKDVTWTSSNTSVATVDANGKVTGKKVGYTVIKAISKINPNIWDHIVFDVCPEISSVAINNIPIDNTMYIGQTHTLGATVSPAGVLNDDVTWQSSKPSVATINPNTGLVTAVSVGKTKITATASNGASKSFELTVKIDSVTIQPDITMFNKVVFNSTGKVWRCVDFDLFFGDTTLVSQRRASLERSNENVYHHYEVNGVEKVERQTFTDEEIKILYAIDPHGVAHYISEYLKRNDLYPTDEAVVAKKDYYFELLFEREPDYFEHLADGRWIKTSDRQISHKVMSESECLFGAHNMYQGDALLDFAEAALSLLVVGVAIASSGASIVVAATFTLGEITIAAANALLLAKGDSRQAVIDIVLETGKSLVGFVLEYTKLGNAIGVNKDLMDVGFLSSCINLFSNVSEIYQKIQQIPTYNKLEIQYYAKNENYDILIKHYDGSITKLKDIAEIITAYNNA